MFIGGTVVEGASSLNTAAFTGGSLPREVQTGDAIISGCIKSLQRAYGKEIDRSRVSQIQEISGNGVTAVVDGHTVAAGNNISRKCLGIVYQNIVVAIGVKLLCLLLIALGFANMWLAVFADVGVMILAVLNAIRALFVKKL